MKTWKNPLSKVAYVSFNFFSSCLPALPKRPISGWKWSYDQASVTPCLTSNRLLPRNEVFQRILWYFLKFCLQNIGQFYKTWVIWKLPIIKIVPRIFIMRNFQLIYKIIFQNRVFFRNMPLFHFKRYWSFIWIHSALGLKANWFCTHGLGTP